MSKAIFEGGEFISPILLIHTSDNKARETRLYITKMAKSWVMVLLYFSSNTTQTTVLGKFGVNMGDLSDSLPITQFIFMLFFTMPSR